MIDVKHSGRIGLLVLEQTEQLTDKERVALRTIQNRRDEATDPLNTGRELDQLGHLGRAEAPQGNTMHTGPPSQAAKGGAECVAGNNFDVTIAADDQDRRIGKMRRQKLQQEEGRLV